MASLQDALSDAFDKHQPEEKNEQPSGSRELATIDTESRELTDTSESTESTESTGAVARARAADGKFTRTEEATGDEVPENQQQEPKKALTPSSAPGPETHVKAPVSWRPEVRGKFGALPPEVQGEIIRREREVEAGLRTSAIHRQFTENFQQAMQPYAAMIQAEGGDYISATTNLMNTAYQLRTAPPMQKAQLVGEIIRHFGVDITMLDDVLSGQVSGHGQPNANDPTFKYIQEQLAPVQQLLVRLQQADQDAKQQRSIVVHSEIEAFASDPKNEYYEDVKFDMADLLELAAKRGQKMSLQDAYSRATIAHPTIGPLVANRQLSVTAQHRNGAAQRARNASASLASSGAPEQGDQGAAKPKDLSSAIAAAWDKVEQRDN